MISAAKVAIESTARRLATTAAALTATLDETVLIPRGEQIEFIANCRDWRNVRIGWRGTPYLVSRASWERAVPETESSGSRRSRVQAEWR